MSRAAPTAAAVAFAGTVAFVAGALSDPARAAFAYLAAYDYFLTIAVGALYWVMIGHVTNAVWFVALRRTAESAVAVLPLLGVLFWPMPLFFLRFYPWVGLHGEERGLSEAAQRALSVYTSLPFFLGRAAAFLAILAVFGGWLRHDSLRQDRDLRRKYTTRPRAVSAVGLFVVGLAFSFAQFDWFMALDPGFRSTMYGVYASAGAAVAGLSLVAVLAELARRTGRLPEAVGVSHLFVVGKLLLTVVLFWAYVGFSQLLLVWIADVPVESVFYLRRAHGAWGTVAAALGVGHFAVPFLLLLSFHFKRSPARVAALGAWLLLLHYVDVYWLVLPAQAPASPRPHWLDLAALAAVGGACVACAVLRARRANPVPVNDPRLGRSLEFENA